MYRLLAAVSAGLLCLAVTACGADPYAGREALSGKVTHKGQPIKDGASLSFDPMDGLTTAAQCLTAGGKYTVPRENGLKPGRYLVRVSLPDNKTAVNPLNPDEPPGPGGGTNIVSKELLPADWNRKSKREVTVTAGGPNTFDFDIP